MAGSPKYLNKKGGGDIPPNISEEDLVWNLFIKSRKRKGAEQAVEVRNYLINETVSREWIPLNEIAEHMKESQNMTQSGLIRLLDEMEKSRVVLKKKINNPLLKTLNKKRTSYQYDRTGGLLTLTDEGYKQAFNKLCFENEKLGTELNAAMSVINSHSLLPEYNEEIRKRNALNPDKDSSPREIQEAYVNFYRREGLIIDHLIKTGKAKDKVEALIFIFTKSGIVSFMKNWEDHL